MVLLKLNAPVVMTDHVSTICLPKNKDTKLPVGTKCYLTGWERLVERVDSSILKQLKVTIRELSECQVSTNIADGLELNEETMICLKPDDHGNGACAGDSGGPLVCSDNVDHPEDGTWTLHGVASFVTDSNSFETSLWIKRDCCCLQFSCSQTWMDQQSLPIPGTQLVN